MDSIASQKQHVIDNIENSIWDMEDIPKQWLEDKEVLMLAFKHIMVLDMMNFVPEKLKDDEEMAMFLVGVKTEHFKKLSKRLRSDETFIKKMLEEKELNIYPFIDKTLFENKELAYIAVKYNGANYEYVSDSLKEDLDLFKYAISRYGDALGDGKFEYINNIDVIKYAMDYCNNVFYWVSNESILNDKKLALYCLERDVYIGDMGKEVCSDKELMLKLLNKDASEYENLPEELKVDLDIIKKAIDCGYKKIVRNLPYKAIGKTDLLTKVLELIEKNGLEESYLEYSMSSMAVFQNEDYKNEYDKRFPNIELMDYCRKIGNPITAIFSVFQEKMMRKGLVVSEKRESLRKF